MKQEEQIWFENWQNGDDRAFDALFRKFYKPLCYAAGKKTGDILILARVTVITFFKPAPRN